MIRHLLMIAITTTAVVAQDTITDTAKTEEASPSGVLPQDAEQFCILQREFVDLLKELGSCIHDLDSQQKADAAADRTGEVCRRILAIMEEGKALGQPNPAIAKILAEDLRLSGDNLEDIAQTSLGGLVAIFFNNCYGSESMMQAITPLMEKLLEGAEMEEPAQEVAIPSASSPESNNKQD